MTRPSLDLTLMAVAHVWSTRSTCSRLRVGAVLARDGRQLAQGYNGAPAGLPHCVHVDDEPCTRAVHAEANVIAAAARYGVSVVDATLYITHAPCAGCAGLLINAGLAEVVYSEPYRSQAGLDALHEAGLGVWHAGDRR